MQKKIFLSLLLLSCSISAQAPKPDLLFVQEVEQPTKGVPSQYQFHGLRTTLSIGPSYAHMNLHTSYLPSEQGNALGAQATAEFLMNRKGYGAAQITWRLGSFTSSYPSHRSLLDIDVQERLGYQWNVANQHVTLFSGFGWRYQGEVLNQEGQPSLGIFYNHVYIPAGLIWSCDFRWFTYAIRSIWMPQVFSTVNLDPTGGARWILKPKIGNVRIEMPFVFKPKRCGVQVGFDVVPFFEYWTDGSTIAHTDPMQIYLIPCPCFIPKIDLGFPSGSYFFYGVTVDLTIAY